MQKSDGSTKFENLSQEEQLSLIRAIAANLANIEATAALLRARKKGQQTYVDVPTNDLIAELRQNLIDTTNLASFMVYGEASFIPVDDDPNFSDQPFIN